MEVTGYIYQARHIKDWNVATGQIFGDKNKRFEDGTFIRTSNVTVIDGDFVRTLNSYYRVISWSQH